MIKLLTIILVLIACPLYAGGGGGGGTPVSSSVPLLSPMLQLAFVFICGLLIKHLKK